MPAAGCLHGRLPSPRGGSGRSKGVGVGELLADGGFAYVSGDYGKPGVPIVEIWLADFDVTKEPAGF
jgi:hypothetical protein